MSQSYLLFRKIILAIFFVFFLFSFSFSQSYNFIKSAESTSPQPTGDCYILTNNDAPKTIFTPPFTFTKINGYWGAVWYTDLLDLNEKFDIEFDINMGTNKFDNNGYDIGGDGLVFVMQTDGSSAYSTDDGGGMGYRGSFVHSIGVEFDTYNNSWSTPPNPEMEADHVGLFINGSLDHSSVNSIAGPAQANSSGELEDGLDHHIRIHWDPSTNLFQVYVECVLKINVNYDIPNNVFGGTKKVYWGFTAGTGGSKNVQKVCVQKTVIAVADTLTICNGSSVLLNAKGAGIGATYLWSPFYKINDTTLQQPTVSPTKDTTYYVSIKDVCGYVQTDSVKVLVNPKPVVNLGVDTAFCSGGSKFLDAGNPGSTYQWIPSSTNRAITVLTAGNYRVTVTSAMGCTASDNVFITVRSLPIANAGTDKNICAGDSANLTATGGSSYKWSSSDNVAAIKVSPPNTTTYTVTVTNTYGCTATDAITVNIKSAVTVNLVDTVTICTGGSVSLTASGGATYVWSTTATDSIISVNPPITTTYSVTVTTNGCSDTDEVVVKVGNVKANAGKDTTLCPGTSYTLKASGGVNYFWSTGEVTDSITVSPINQTTYTLIATGGWCADTDTIVIFMNPLPTADAGTSSVLCSGTTTNLTASGGISYHWNTNELTSVISVTPIKDSTFTVTVTDANGCTDDDTITVIVKNIPTANAGVDSLICAGDSVNLIANGGTTYLWSTSQTTSSIIVKPFFATTYTVTAIQNGCTDADEVEVTVSTTVADPGHDTTVCPGSPVMLKAKGGTSYKWSTTETTASITVSPIVSSTYSVTVTNGFCTASDMVVVSMDTLPLAEAGNDITVCIGATPSLTATGGVSYHWNTGADSASISVSPIVQTKYTVTVIDKQGCSNIDSVQVNIQDSLNISAGKDTTICAGTALNLLASGGAVYIWDTGDNTNQIAVTPVTTTTYTVTGTDGGLFCMGVNSVIVTVNASPIANAGIDSSICSGDTIILKATGGIKYAWSTLDSVDITTVSPSVAATYTVTVSNGICTDTDEVVVNVSNFIISGGVNNISICKGKTAVLSASGGVDYIWNTGAVTATISDSPIIQTTYSVTITDIEGCSGSQEVVVSIDSLPSYTLSSVAPVCAGTQINFNASASISYNYIWSTGAVNSGFLWATPLTNTTYTVTAATFLKGCTSTASVSVVVYSLPTASITGTDSICPRKSSMLTVTGGDTYLWNTGDSAFAILVKPTVNTTYTVTAISIEKCIDTASFNITIKNGLVVDAGSDQEICKGANATISVSTIPSTSQGYKWNTLDTTQTIIVSPLSTTTYTVTAVSLLNGCAYSDEVLVTVSIPPTANAGKDTTICNGNSTTLSANGGISYKWDNSVLTQTTIVSPVIKTTYTVTVTDAKICTNTDEVIVTIQELPTADIIDQMVCKGFSKSLVASGGINYIWNTGEVTADINKSPVVTTTYTVTVIDDLGCSDTEDGVITVLSDASLLVSGNSRICLGSSATLIASGCKSFVWNTTEITDTIIVNPLTTSTYTVTGTDINGCTNTAIQQVIVSSLPNTPAVSDVKVCEGMDIAGKYRVISPVDGEVYSWYNAEKNGVLLTQGTQLIFVHGAQPKVYVEAIDLFGCISLTRAVAQVVSGVEPIADFSVNPTRAIINTPITFTDKSVNASTWIWTFGYIYTSTSSLANPIYNYDKPGTYKIELIVVSPDGCRDTATLVDYVVSLQEQVYVADAFTPNGDNKNDVLHVLGSDIEFSCQIYNQWGIKVFETNNKDRRGWDGTYNNKPQPSGNYTCILTAITSDGVPINWQKVVSLIR